EKARGPGGGGAGGVPAVIASKAQITKHFIIGNHAYSRPSIPPRSGDLTAYMPAMTTPLSFNPAPSWRRLEAADVSPDRRARLPLRAGRMRRRRQAPTAGRR